MRRATWRGADEAMKWPLFRSVRAVPFSGIAWVLAVILFANNGSRTDMDVILPAVGKPLGYGDCAMVVRATARRLDVCEIMRGPDGLDSRCISDDNLSSLLDLKERERHHWCAKDKGRLPIVVMGNQCRSYREAYEIASVLAVWDGFGINEVTVGSEEARLDGCDIVDGTLGDYNFWTWRDGMSDQFQ